MRIYVVVGENRRLANISARAAFTTKEKAQDWIDNPKENWFNDVCAIVELELEQ